MTKTITKTIGKILAYAKKIDWNVEISNDEMSVEFSKYSPAGQDFFFEICLEQVEDELEQAELFLNAIKSYYGDYNPSQEAYYWLDETGHGRNGAPYEMRDVLDDMEACVVTVDRCPIGF